MPELGVKLARHSRNRLVTKVFEGEINQVEVHALKHDLVGSRSRGLETASLVQTAEGFLLSYVGETGHYS